jgi:hypothetical protein
MGGDLISKKAINAKIPSVEIIILIFKSRILIIPFKNNQLKFKNIGIIKNVIFAVHYENQSEATIESLFFLNEF